jgi:hypothetical protein
LAARAKIVTIESRGRAPVRPLDRFLFDGWPFVRRPHDAAIQAERAKLPSRRGEALQNEVEE